MGEGKKDTLDLEGFGRVWRAHEVLPIQLAAAGVIENGPDRFDKHILFPAALNCFLLEGLSRGVSVLLARQRINFDR